MVEAVDRLLVDSGVNEAQIQREVGGRVEDHFDLRAEFRDVDFDRIGHDMDCLATRLSIRVEFVPQRVVECAEPH